MVWSLDWGAQPVRNYRRNLLQPRPCDEPFTRTLNISPRPYPSPHYCSVSFSYPQALLIFFFSKFSKFPFFFPQICFPRFFLFFIFMFLRQQPLAVNLEICLPRRDWPWAAIAIYEVPSVITIRHSSGLTCWKTYQAMSFEHFLDVVLCPPPLPVTARHVV